MVLITFNLHFKLLHIILIIKNKLKVIGNKFIIFIDYLNFVYYIKFNAVMAQW